MGRKPSKMGLETLALIKIVATVASVSYSVASGIKARSAAKDAKREAAERASRRNVSQAVPARTILYGEVNTGGPYLYIDNPDDDKFVCFIKMASHEVEAFLRVSINEEALNVPTNGGAVTSDSYAIYRYNVRGQYTEKAVTEGDYDSYPNTGIFTVSGVVYEGKVKKEGEKYKGHMWIYPVYGDGSQDIKTLLTQDEANPSAVFASNDSTSFSSDDLQSTDTFDGASGLIVKTHKLSKEFPDLSPNWNALVRGKKVLRSNGSTAWSNNPAECARDWLENYTDSALSPITDDESWTECAEDCAGTITTKEGLIRPRYMCNGIAISNEERREVLEQIQLSMAGDISYAGDSWYYRAGVWKDAAITYESTEVLREVEVNFQGRSSDVPTAAKASLISAEHNWAQVESSVQQVGEEDELRVDLDLTLNYVTFQEQAQRICRIEANRGRRERSAVLQFGPRGLMVRPGTVGIYTIPMMESAGSDTYEVESFERKFQNSDSGVVYETTHTIRETGESDYYWDAETMEGELIVATNNLSSNTGSSPSDVGFVRTDYNTETTSKVSILATWKDPSVNGKDISYMEIIATLDGDEKKVEVAPTVGRVTLIWTPYSADPVTLSVRAYFDDGTNSGAVLA